jgi:transposase
VINVATEKNIETLRQVAMLLERENSRLHSRLQELSEKLARAEGKDAASLQLEIAHLKETLADRNRAIFGPSSEIRPRTDTPAKTKDAAAKRGHGPSEQPELPIVEVIHDLDEPDKVCPSCGGQLAEMDGQFEEADEIEIVERSFQITRHKRKKYSCKCGGCVETALGPPKLIPGGRYSIGFATAVAIAKYTDHMPLARQVRQMLRAGLTVTTQTLWDQLFALSKHLEPTYEALHAHVLSSPVVGADETTWRLMEANRPKTWWAWSVCSTDEVYYHIHPSRSAEAAAAILRDYSGVVICDGYTAYSALRKNRAATRDGPPPFTLAHCWAHVRRKFIEAEPHDPRAGEVLDLIGKLYEVEGEARVASNGDLHERRAALRQARSRETVAEIRRWMLEQRALPGSSLGKAIRYTDGIWQGLTRFLDNPAVDLDNNATERTMRGVAVGRKNHHGSKSLRGTRVAAIFYSLIESAKLAGVEPSAYIREAARRAIESPGTVTLPSTLHE